MTVTYYIRSGDTVLTGSRKFHCADEKNLKLFAGFLIRRTRDQVLESLKAGLPVIWYETYDVINPFKDGDIRTASLESVWLFDLEDNVLLIRKKDLFASVDLDPARQRRLTLDDFTPLSSPPAGPTDRIEQLNSEKLWEPDVEGISKTKFVPERILKDFVYSWRHLLRKQQNDITFSKLAHAIVSIAMLKFSVSDRTGSDHSKERPYVWIDDLPQWDTLNGNFVRVGASWFVLTQDVPYGVDLIQQHINKQNHHGDDLTSCRETYIILTLQHIILCRAHGKDLEWAQPEVFFNSEETISDRAIDMILWAAHSPLEPTLLHKFPVEIQDLILHFSCVSSAGAATLGCQLGLGSPFTWGNKETIIELEDCKRKLDEFSKPESQIFLEGGFTGVSYKPRRRSPNF